MNKKLVILADLIAVAAAFFASAQPDGLEKVAETLGFSHAGVAGSSVMTDYSLPFLKSGVLSTVFSGFVGIALCLGLFCLAGVIYSNVRSSQY